MPRRAKRGRVNRAEPLRDEPVRTKRTYERARTEPSRAEPKPSQANLSWFVPNEPTCGLEPSRAELELKQAWLEANEPCLFYQLSSDVSMTVCTSLISNSMTNLSNQVHQLSVSGGFYSQNSARCSVRFLWTTVRYFPSINNALCLWYSWTALGTTAEVLLNIWSMEHHLSKHVSKWSDTHWHKLKCVHNSFISSKVCLIV